MRTIRGEVLDWTLPARTATPRPNPPPLQAAYNEQRPHRALDLAVPDGPAQLPTGLPDRIERTDILGGPIHEYDAVAA